ncbi:MAG: DNA primase [Clostridia bacterium]|nr:DNA primase [Clostridia bacterium]
MAIPESFVQTIIDRADIVDVVSRYVKLRKSGANYFGLCPFHGEKTPSFSVSPDKQIFHCFGCSEGGGVISFIMKIESLNFQEAVKFLADMYGLEMPENDADDEGRRRRERMLALNKEAARFFHATLNSEIGMGAMEYFRNRGLSNRTITNFGLGFAPESWDALTGAMLRKGFTKTELADAGLASKNKSGSIYDRFRNRVMFPIIDVRGNVIAFGGRVLDDSLPKYINSSDTPVYNKSRNLFAINIAKKTKRKNFILAEGYMDVIALHQAGFDNAIASLGTAFTPEQARLIARFKDEVVICYDSDDAGQKATARAMEILQKNAINVRVLKVPNAKDPDEFIKKNGAVGFEKLLEKPQVGNEYRLSVIKNKHNLDIDEEKIAYMKEAINYVAGIYSDVEREIYARNIASDTGVSAAAVIKEIEKTRNSKGRRDRKAYEKDAASPVKNSQPKSRELKYENIRSAKCEEGVLAIILKNDEFIPKTMEKLTSEMFSSDFLGKIYETIVEKYNEHESISLHGIVNFLEPVESAHITSLCTTYRYPANGLENALDDCIDTIRTEYIKRNSEEQDPMLELIRKKKEWGK